MFQHWGGDCESTYEAMAEAMRGALSLTLSGFGFASHDIGGFEVSLSAFRQKCIWTLSSRELHRRIFTAAGSPLAYSLRIRDFMARDRIGSHGCMASMQPRHSRNLWEPSID